jgi:hypothetical protein
MCEERHIDVLHLSAAPIFAEEDATPTKMAETRSVSSPNAHEQRRSALQRTCTVHTWRPAGHSGVLRVISHETIPTLFVPTGRFTISRSTFSEYVAFSGMTSSSASTSLSASPNVTCSTQNLGDEEPDGRGKRRLHRQQPCICLTQSTSPGTVRSITNVPKPCPLKCGTGNRYYPTDACSIADPQLHWFGCPSDLHNMSIQ